MRTEDEIRRLLASIQFCTTGARRLNRENIRATIAVTGLLDWLTGNDVVGSTIVSLCRIEVENEAKRLGVRVAFPLI